jgi:murein DD-endopeptidase MepM/ murein hydrolase activator NlpD
MDLMSNTAARQRYSGRPPIAVRTQYKAGRSKSKLSVIIEQQLLICIVLLAIVVVAQNSDIPAAESVNKGIEYILTNETKIDALASGTKKLVADIRDSIMKADENSSSKMAQVIDQNYTLDQMPASGETLTSSNDVASSGAQTSSGALTSSGAQTSDGSSGNYTEAFNKYYYNDSETPLADETTMPESSVLSATSDRFAEDSGMLLPVDGTLNTLYGAISESGVIHNGIDIDVYADSSVRAVLDGVIVDKGVSREYGSYVKVKHPNGLETVYAHLSSIAVDMGNDVRKGDIIASVGNAGPNAKSHLHFEVWKENEPVDPLEYVSVPFN